MWVSAGREGGRSPLPSAGHMGPSLNESPANTNKQLNYRSDAVDTGVLSDSYPSTAIYSCACPQKKQSLAGRDFMATNDTSIHQRHPISSRGTLKNKISGKICGCVGG